MTEKVAAGVIDGHGAQQQRRVQVDVERGVGDAGRDQTLRRTPTVASTRPARPPAG